MKQTLGSSNDTDSSSAISCRAVTRKQIYRFHHPVSLSLFLYPSSVQLLQDAQASEGQVVVLECRVRGSPPLQVRWYRQGEEILDSPDFRILQKSETLVRNLLFFLPLN